MYVFLFICRWYDSMRNSLYKFQTTVLKSPQHSLFSFTFGWKRKSYVSYRANLQLSEAMNASKEDAINFYKKWENEVKSHVPEDRLLLFSVKEGWGPLCQFLGLPVPESPFPNVNDSASIQKKLQLFKAASWAYNIIVTSATIGAVAAFCVYLS